MSTNIINLLEDDIPEFLKSSPFLQSLITDDVFPSGGIEVPADCIKTDTQVANISDLEGLLRTVRYWLLPDLLADLLDLHVFVFDPKNEADVVQVLDNFKTELTYLNTLLPLISCDMEEKLSFAAGRGFATLLDSLCQMEKVLQDKDKPIDWQCVIHSAAVEGKLSCLQFLCAKGYRWRPDSLNVTAEYGHLDCLIFFVNESEAEGGVLHANSMFWEAAKGSHISILRYLHDKFGHPQEDIQAMVYCSAATSGNLEAMNFLDTHGFATANSFTNAAGEGHVHVLKYLINKFGVPGEEEAQGAWKGAAEGGHLEVLRFLQEHVSPLIFPGDANDGGDEVEEVEDSSAVMYCAVESGSIPCVAYLRELGHPWSSDFTRFAADQEKYDLFWYLIEQGCPCSYEECSWTFAGKGSLEALMHFRDKKLLWGAGTCECAAKSGHLECLQFLVENGCPVDYDTICESAAQRLDCLTYAHQLGGRLTPAAAVQAAQSRAEECLKYMHSNGCTFTVDVANAAVFIDRRHLDSPSFELLQLLLEAGCPVNEETCICAATVPWCKGLKRSTEAHLACLKLLHERGCPWDESTCIAAADSDFLEGLQYAIEHGCPWGEKTRVAAAKSVPFASARYIIEHGRPWDEQTSMVNCAAYLNSLISLKRKNPTDSCV